MMMYTLPHDVYVVMLFENLNDIISCILLNVTKKNLNCNIYMHLSRQVD